MEERETLFSTYEKAAKMQIQKCLEAYKVPAIKLNQIMFEVEHDLHTIQEKLLCN